MSNKVSFNVWGRNLALFSMVVLFCICKDPSICFGFFVFSFFFPFVLFSSPLALPCFVYVGGQGNAAYGICVSVIFFPFIWPVYHLRQLLIFTQIFWVMALLLAGLSVYPYFLTPTIFPAILMDLAAILYLVAAIRREKGLSLADLSTADNRLWMKM
jgi:hypothetical protein